MKAIGPDHRTKELAGLHLVTMESSSSRVTGREVAAASNTIIAGTTTGIGTSATMIVTVITTMTTDEGTSGLQWKFHRARLTDGYIVLVNQDQSDKKKLNPEIIVVRHE